jgi:hypothetical protein
MPTSSEHVEQDMYNAVESTYSELDDDKKEMFSTLNEDQQNFLLLISQENKGIFDVLMSQPQEVIIEQLSKLEAGSGSYIEKNPADLMPNAQQEQAALTKEQIKGVIDSTSSQGKPLAARKGDFKNRFQELKAPNIIDAVKKFVTDLREKLKSDTAPPRPGE